MSPPTVRQALVASALLSAGLVGLSLLVFDPFFTNDGAVMTMIASGTGLALRPDEHLVFTNVLIGRALAALYRRAPGVPWYGLHLFAVQALAWAALFHATLVRGLDARRVGACVLAFGVVGLSVLVNLQFSSTAFLATTAGACLWIARATGGAGLGRASLAAGGALLVLGSLVRFDPFVLTAALAAVAVAIAGGGRVDRPLLLAAAATLAVATGARAWDEHVYRQDPGWRAFREFIPLLPRIVDYGRGSVRDEDEALQRAGWTGNDHRLFMQWFHADPEVYSTDALRRLLAAAPAPGAVERLAGGTERLGPAARNPALWAMLLALPWLLMPRGVASRRAVALLATLLVAALLAALLLAAFLKSAPQVYLSLFAFAIAATLVVPAPAGPQRRPVVAWAAAVLALGGLVVSAAFQHEEGRVERARSLALRQRVEPLVRSSDRLVVAWFNAFPFEVVRPLEPTTGLGALRLFSLGWSQRTPLARDLLVSFGSADLLDALVDPRTVLLAPPSAPPLLALYAEEHRGLRLRFTPEQTDPFTTFRARIEPRGAGPPAN